MAFGPGEDAANIRQHDQDRRHREGRRAALAEELAKFRAWFEEFDARLFDAKIERDAKAGKLDKLMAEAWANHTARGKNNSEPERMPS